MHPFKIFSGILLASIIATPAMAATTLKVELGYGMAAEHEAIHYAVNDITGNDSSKGLGDGAVAGLGVNIDLKPGQRLEINYHGTGLSSKDDAGFLVIGGGACNIKPYLGLISDCWDAANIEQHLAAHRIDILFDMDKVNGNTTITPFAGVRYLRTIHEINTEYLYKSGVSNFTNNNSRYSGWGPIVGASLKRAFDSSSYVSGRLAVSQLWGNRNLEVRDQEIRTPGGTTTDLQKYSDGETIDSAWNVDAELLFGMNNTNKSHVEFGYQYSLTRDIIDGHNTNNRFGKIGTLGTNLDLSTHTLFVRYLTDL